MKKSHHTNHSLTTGLLALSVASMILLPTAGTAFAAPAGTNFDHIIIIAMENQHYTDVLGDGTPTGCPSGTAPFLCSMLPLSSTIPNYHSYCVGSSDRACTGAGTLGNPPCSAACYTAVTSGATYGVSDGVSQGSVSHSNIFDSLTSAGLSWTEFCESGCPRGPDHSPCLQYADTYNSPNCVTLSMALVGNSQVLGSTSNYVWITPTDSHNMHNNGISSGDSWLKSFLIGSGSTTSPAPGSLLSSSLFTNPSYHTLLWIWWDEYDPSPNLQYGPMIHKGFVSTSNSWDEYSTLRMIENNWGLPTLSYDAQAPVMSDILAASGGSSALSASFTYTLPSTASTGTTVTFTGSASGGKAPYSYSWNFGDGTSAVGTSTTHTFSKTGTYSVTMTVTDANSTKATSTRLVTVSNPIPPITLLIIGVIAGGAVGISVFVARYYSRNRKLSASLKNAQQN